MPDTFPLFTLPFPEWWNREVVHLVQEAWLLGKEKDIPVVVVPLFPHAILQYAGKGKCLKNLDEERKEKLPGLTLETEVTCMLLYIKSSVSGHVNRP